MKLFLNPADIPLVLSQVIFLSVNDTILGNSIAWRKEEFFYKKYFFGDIKLIHALSNDILTEKEHAYMN